MIWVWVVLVAISAILVYSTLLLLFTTRCHYCQDRFSKRLIEARTRKATAFQVIPKNTKGYQELLSVFKLRRRMVG